MMIENIENEKDCCGSCDFCMFDNNGNAVCADDNSKHKYGDIIWHNVTKTPSVRATAPAEGVFYFSSE